MVNDIDSDVWSCGYRGYGMNVLYDFEELLVWIVDDILYLVPCTVSIVGLLEYSIVQYSLKIFRPASSEIQKILGGGGMQRGQEQKIHNIF